MAGWRARRRFACRGSTPGSSPIPTTSNGELYQVSQPNIHLDSNPDKLQQLQAACGVEARKYNVFPLESSMASRAGPAIRASLTRDLNEFTYFPRMIRIPEGCSLEFKNKAWTA